MGLWSGLVVVPCVDNLQTMMPPNPWALANRSLLSSPPGVGNVGRVLGGEGCRALCCSPALCDAMQSMGLS